MVFTAINNFLLHSVRSVGNRVKDKPVVLVGQLTIKRVFVCARNVLGRTRGRKNEWIKNVHKKINLLEMPSLYYILA